MSVKEFGVGFKEMQKAIAIIILGLFWCNVSFAETEESIIEKYKSSLKLCVVGVVSYYDFPRWQAWTDCFGVLKKRTAHGTWIVHAEYKNGFQTGKTLIEYPNGDRLFTKIKKEICSGKGYVITADGTIFKVKLTKDCVVKSQKVIK